MPSQPMPIAKPILLLGEGKDEVGFFEALLEDLQRSDIQVEDYQGKDKLPRLPGWPARSIWLLNFDFPGDYRGDASTEGERLSIRKRCRRPIEFGIHLQSGRAEFSLERPE